MPGSGVTYGRPWLTAFAMVLLCIVLTQLYDGASRWGLALPVKNTLGLLLFGTILLGGSLVYAWLCFHGSKGLPAALLLPLAWVGKELVAGVAVLGWPGLSALVFLIPYLILQIFLIGVVDLACRFWQRRGSPNVALVGWHSLMIVIPLLLFLLAGLAVLILLG